MTDYENALFPHMEVSSKIPEICPRIIEERINLLIPIGNGLPMFGFVVEHCILFTEDGRNNKGLINGGYKAVWQYEDKQKEEIRVLEKRLNNSGFWYKDFHGGNVGYLNGKPVLVDFDLVKDSQTGALLSTIKRLSKSN